MEKPKWINPKKEIPDFDCSCWCAHKITFKVYDYNSMELGTEIEDIYEEIVDVDGGQFEMPSLISNWGASRVYVGFTEDMFERKSAYEFHAQMLDHGNKKVNWDCIMMIDIEILGYVILPDDWEQKGAKQHGI